MFVSEPDREFLVASGLAAQMERAAERVQFAERADADRAAQLFD